MSDRDEFEAWAVSTGAPVERDEIGVYVHPSTINLWMAWQAARRWRPIEEADLEQDLELLVCDPKGRVWLICVEAFDDTPQDGCTSYGFYAYGEIDVGRVTHFQYLPEPHKE